MNRRDFLVTSGRVAAAAGLGGLGLAVSRLLTQPSAPPSRPAIAGPPHRALANGPPNVANVKAKSPRSNGIVRENAHRGTDRWLIDGLSATIAGYVSRASAAPGDPMTLHVDAPADFDVEWYRLGWYGGQGGRLVRVDPRLPARPGQPPHEDPATGRAEGVWDPSLEIEISADWPTGMYAAVLRPVVGNPAYAPFIVKRQTGARAPVLFVSAALTWQAYNLWGGANLYDASTADSPEVSDGQRAVQVSFDRPYTGRQGAGYQQRWELPFVRWQEREGRDVDYAADLDLELDPDVLSGRRLIVFAGHHEYWSRPMRTALEAAVAAGTNVAFLSANEVYWQVRLEPSPLGPARRITCYKSARLDPFAQTQPALTTCRWRDSPVNEPEAPLVGQMYGHIVRRPADWVAVNTAHWLYEGTALNDGEHLVNLVGQEYDAFFPGLANPGTVVLAQSPVDAAIRQESFVGRYASPATHNATIYTADSGATVFAAGTFQWSWAIDAFGDRSYRGVATPYDDRVVQMTRNLFDRLGDGAG